MHQGSRKRFLQQEDTEDRDAEAAQAEPRQSGELSLPHVAVFVITNLLRTVTLPRVRIISLEAEVSRGLACSWCWLGNYCLRSFDIIQ